LILGGQIRGQIRIWYATHFLIVVNNHAKFHPSTIE
jgi:hypothetical protein